MLRCAVLLLCCAAAAVLREWRLLRCCGASGRLLRARRVRQHLVVVEELAERVGLVVEEGLLLRRQLSRVRVEQVLKARRARENVAVEACGATVRHGAEAGMRTVGPTLPGVKLPCAPGTYSTLEAGTRSPYAQYMEAPGSTCQHVVRNRRCRSRARPSRSRSS